MKKIFNLLLCFSPFITLNAQINEIGVFLGGSNFVGDVGNTTYVAPEKPAFGILYKWNKSPRHAYRFSYTQSAITGNDLDSKEGGRNKRGFSFENNIKELSAGLEFNFFDFNLHDLDTKITPYIFSGLSYFRYDKLYIANGKTEKDNGSGSSFAIPIIIGLKSNISRRFVLAAEIGARYTFTDNIDGSFPEDDSLANNRFGNLNNKDWYVFTGATLTYTFGQKPCYCAE
ncbi:MAG: DUF6089 family protein [Flavobacterium sp.]